MTWEMGVNLPRWGLKPAVCIIAYFSLQSVNLPRWGLKRYKIATFIVGCLCKFTPLGFETGLRCFGLERRTPCKFTPLGFETY